MSITADKPLRFTFGMVSPLKEFELHPEIAEVANKDFYRIIFEEIAFKVKNRAVTTWVFSNKEGVDNLFDLIFIVQAEVCGDGKGSAVHRANRIKGVIVEILSRSS